MQCQIIFMDFNQFFNSYSSIANFSFPNHTHNNSKAVIAALKCALMHHKTRHPQRKNIQIEQCRNTTTLSILLGGVGGRLWWVLATLANLDSFNTQTHVGN